MYKVLLVLNVAVFGCMLSGEAQEILLWPKGAPGSEGKSGAEKVRIAETGDHVISNIHQPSITPFLATGANKTNAAVVIAPGGGHRELWIDHEGYNVARWLNEQGINAFVLKYRLSKEEGSTYTIEQHELGDMKRAIRLVKSRAKEWGIDTARIGVMGFSAGGQVAALSAYKFEKERPAEADVIDRLSSRPAFQALVYPGGTAGFEVAKGVPPLFLVGGFNDRQDIAEGMAQLYVKYKQAGVPAEIHMYAKAGHGFGVRKTNQDASKDWLQRFADWLSDSGFLSNK